MKFDYLRFFCTWCYSGLAPKAPGTFGTIATIPFYLLIAGLTPSIYLLIVVSIFFLGVYASDLICKQHKASDPSYIVVDEAVGFLISMFNIDPSFYSVVMGFILFRFFDILKPWPISIIDKNVKGGLGVMLDDVVAGLFVCLILNFLTTQPSFLTS